MALTAGLSTTCPLLSVQVSHVCTQGIWMQLHYTNTFQTTQKFTNRNAQKKKKKKSKKIPEILSSIGINRLMNIRLPTVTTHLNWQTTSQVVLLRLKKKVPILFFSIELKSRKEICSCLDNKLNEVLSTKTLKCSGAIFTVKVLSKSISQFPKLGNTKSRELPKPCIASSATLQLGSLCQLPTHMLSNPPWVWAAGL